MTHYHSADEVAARLGLSSARWLRRHARELPHTRVGRQYLWDDADVEALRAALRVRPGRPASSSELRPITGTRRAS